MKIVVDDIVTIEIDGSICAVLHVTLIDGNGKVLFSFFEPYFLS